MADCKLVYWWYAKATGRWRKITENDVPHLALQPLGWVQRQACQYLTFDLEVPDVGWLHVVGGTWHGKQMPPEGMKKPTGNPFKPRGFGDAPTAPLVTLPDGRVFPLYGDEILSWDIGVYMTPNERQRGYPRARAVIQAMRSERPERLERERREMLKAAFDRMFGHNAQQELDLINEELHRG